MIVNVASKCGLTPQYEQLEQLQRDYADRGFTVLGFPCNQFLGQEPGSMEEILEYCSVTWGISFPIEDKIKVNGPGAAPLYKALKKAKDEEGKRGPVLWNFEKFVLTPAGNVHRFRPQTRPDDPAIVEVIEANLPR
ncbi:glutathione peroxidase [Microbacterium sp. W2R]|nr:glutathione peroxidase [Microbacterium nymphoidis]